MLQRLLKRFYNRHVDGMATIMGLDSAGKTTLLYRLALNDVVQTIPSIGFNVETFKVPTSSGRKLTLYFMDIGIGCGSFLQVVMPFSGYSDAIVWVVDSGDAERLDESVKRLNSLIKLANSRPTPQKDKECPILILANKRDKPNALSSTVIRDSFATVCANRIFEVFSTSATDDIRVGGLPEAFDWLLDALKKRLPTSSTSMAPLASAQEEKIPDVRSPTMLSEKLESWIFRAENDSSPEEFISQFDNVSLPAWDHYTHIRIAYTILTAHGRQKGKNMIFDGIERYIANSPNTRGRTFHVSMTYFWIQLVHFGIRSMPPMYAPSSSDISLSDSITVVETPQKAEFASPSLADFSAFLMLNPYVVDGNLWADYYSKETLMSPGAKTGVVLPDKKPLPNLVVRDAVTAMKGQKVAST